MADEFTWSFAGQLVLGDRVGQRASEETRRRLLGPLMAQFSDYRVRALELIAEGERVVVRAQAAGEDDPRR